MACPKPVKMCTYIYTSNTKKLIIICSKVIKIALKNRETKIMSETKRVSGEKATEMLVGLPKTQQ